MQFLPFLWRWAPIGAAIICIIVLLIGFRYDHGIDLDIRDDRGTTRSHWRVTFEPNIRYFFTGQYFDLPSTTTSEDAAAITEHMNIISSIITCMKLSNYTDYASLPAAL